MTALTAFTGSSLLWPLMVLAALVVIGCFALAAARGWRE